MSRLRIRTPGERAKLTSIYASLLIAVCAALIVIVYVLLRQTLPISIGSAIESASLTPAVSAQEPSGTPSSEPTAVVPNDSADTTAIVASQVALNRYLAVASFTLLVLAALSVWIAWWLAGRVLRPVAVMAHAARTMSVTNLSQRIELRAPPGELKQLADTFDQLLDRIDALVSSQQRFVANAAHELRTQLAVQRSAAEVGLADPTPDRVRRIRSKLLEAADENEQLLEGLLLLAVTDQGLQRLEPVSVEQLVVASAHELTIAAAASDVDLRTSLKPLTVDGDGILLKHLVRNLIINSITYNKPSGGVVTVTTSAHELVVNNTGEIIAEGDVGGLFEPFRRLNPRQHRPGEGAGLGLAIVSSIAKAHHASVSAEANPEGGLTVRVRFSELSSARITV